MAKEKTYELKVCYLSIETDSPQAMSAALAAVGQVLESAFPLPPAEPKKRKRLAHRPIVGEIVPVKDVQ